MDIQISRIILIGLSLALANCASKPNKPQTQISVRNISTYEMQQPKVCYYDKNDAKVCQQMNTHDASKIRVKSEMASSIRAGEKIRIMVPYNIRHRMGSVMYNPNCHIITDFFPHEDLSYIAEAKIEAVDHNPDKGFNCELKMYKLVDGQKLPAENVVTQYRYSIPRENEIPANYIDDYSWNL